MFVDQGARNNKSFHISDLLAVAAGRPWVSQAGLGGPGGLLTYMTGEQNLFDIALARVADECRADLLGQHPWLENLAVPEKEPLISAREFHRWLDAVARQHGALFDVSPLRDPLDHTSLDMVTELRLFLGVVKREFGNGQGLPMRFPTADGSPVDMVARMVDTFAVTADADAMSDSDLPMDVRRILAVRTACARAADSFREMHSAGAIARDAVVVTRDAVEEMGRALNDVARGLDVVELVDVVRVRWQPADSTIDGRSRRQHPLELGFHAVHKLAGAAAYLDEALCAPDNRRDLTDIDDETVNGFADAVAETWDHLRTMSEALTEVVAITGHLCELAGVEKSWSVVAPFGASDFTVHVNREVDYALSSRLEEIGRGLHSRSTLTRGEERLLFQIDSHDGAEVDSRDMAAELLKSHYVLRSIYTAIMRVDPTHPHVERHEVSRTSDWRVPLASSERDDGSGASVVAAKFGGDEARIRELRPRPARRTRRSVGSLGGSATPSRWERTAEGSQDAEPIVAEATHVEPTLPDHPHTESLDDGDVPTLGM